MALNEEAPDDQQPSNRQKKGFHPIMKFSGMAFSMAASIALGTFAGRWLDGQMETARPLWTAAGALLGTLLAIYQVIKTLKT